MSKETDGLVAREHANSNGDMAIGDKPRRHLKQLLQAMLRGGRITKHKGTVASLAPVTGTVERMAWSGSGASVRLPRLARAALLLGAAPAALFAFASPALAQDACTETTPGSGNYVCTDLGLPATTTQTITGSTIIVEIEDGFDVNASAATDIRAARLLVPRMLARGGGYLLSTASAAGLLAQIGSAPYSVTKHAAVSFAEWLAITHGREGLKVSVLCPQGVDTPLIADLDTSTVDKDGLLSAEAVAQTTLEAIAEERFLILPHPEVADYLRQKGADPERWIGGMQRWQARLNGEDV